MKSVIATLLMLIVVVAPSPAQEDSNRAISSVGEADAGLPPPDEERFSPDGSGRGAASSAGLESYLAGLEGRAAAWSFLLAFPDLLFAAGSAQIDVLVQGELARMADFLRTHPDTTARITGYTDDRGGTAANMILGELRAAAVRSYLIELGIDADRLVVTGEGEASPRRDNRTSDGRDSNRRVQILVQNPAAR